MSSKTLQLLVGTAKGAFVIDGDPARRTWSVRGPFCDGWPINHVVGDPATGTIWAGGGGDWFGAGIWRSEDGGDTWSLTKLTSGQADEWAATDPEFADRIGWTAPEPPFGTRFGQVWSLGRVAGGGGGGYYVNSPGGSATVLATTGPGVGGAGYKSAGGGGGFSPHGSVPGIRLAMVAKVLRKCPGG